VTVKGTLVARNVPVFFVVLVPVHVLEAAFVLVEMRVSQMRMSMFVIRISMNLTPAPVSNPKAKSQERDCGSERDQMSIPHGHGRADDPKKRSDHEGCRYVTNAGKRC